MSGDIAGLYGGAAVPTDQPDASTGEDFAPLPPGWYPVEIDAAEVKDTKRGDGKYLKLTMTVLGDAFGGRKLIHNITLLNPNEKATQIGMRDLAGLGQACGLQAIGDTGQLVGATIDVRTKVQKGRNGYGDDTKVTAYAAVGSKSGGASAPAAAPSRAPASATARPSGQARRPWEKPEVGVDMDQLPF